MYICRHYNIFIINFMRNRFFGMLATIMMGGAVMTGLTACSNTDNNTAMIVNSLIMNTPITGSQTVAGIPTIYSKITVITKDDL